ncbi:hypothetical protein COV15_01250 [Candidatus Woesearchaeota archaeon CG10_big_fil_rev_8_21_14_0_10_34_12]|nr:MAG: hypothetical protein COV15_01250 [Candidatus Woesearchaeota archaeon CG10_big_fil_rev_8_21_14_0_10_34_12]
MWNLYQKNEAGDKFLPPLKFSNGKTQEDVVNEVVKTIKQGHKVIFIKGICGTGKSAIALNLAKEIGKTSIVVPVKTLQNQYEEDYTNKKYLLKENGENLKIKVITGRQNFQCPFLKEDSTLDKLDRKSETTTLDIFYNQDFQQEDKDSSCDNKLLPCKIEIKEKNMKFLREYLKQNPKVNPRDFFSINRIRRMSIAPICPYWSPAYSSEIEVTALTNAKKKNYLGLNNQLFTIHQRKKGCGYYDQYDAYSDADVLIFNSHKYKIESAMNRKPSTELEIIDECDEFLDSFSNIQKLNISKLNYALSLLFSEDERTRKKINELVELTFEILKEKKSLENLYDEEIIPLNQTKIFEILEKFLNNHILDSSDCDDENYCYEVEEIARTFEDFFKETYVSFYKEDKSLIAKIVTTNLEKRFKEILDKNKVFVMMSGTLHSEKVLRDVFGINDFKIVEAETKTPGKITEIKTGLEIDCRYDNFSSGRVSREQYLKALSKCISTAKLPILVHVNSFADLPTEFEAKEYESNIMTQEKLKQLQKQDTMGSAIQKFKEGSIEILYSTKCNRGVDFPGEICNSIILTKFPYPNVKSIFWKILRKTRPQHCSSFYLDKSNREFLQKIYRGLRSENDHIYLLSPDSRVFGRIIVSPHD